MVLKAVLAEAMMVKAVTAEAVVALVALHSVVEMANSVAEVVAAKAMMVSGESMVLADCEAMDSPSPGRGRTGKGQNDQSHQERPKDDPILPTSRFHHSPFLIYSTALRPRSGQALGWWLSRACGEPRRTTVEGLRASPSLELRLNSTAAARCPGPTRYNRS